MHHALCVCLFLIFWVGFSYVQCMVLALADAFDCMYCGLMYWLGSGPRKCFIGMLMSLIERVSVRIEYMIFIYELELCYIHSITYFETIYIISRQKKSKSLTNQNLSEIGQSWSKKGFPSNFITNKGIRILTQWKFQPTTRLVGNYDRVWKWPNFPSWCWSEIWKKKFSQSTPDSGVSTRNPAATLGFLLILL